MNCQLLSSAYFILLLGILRLKGILVAVKSAVPIPTTPILYPGERNACFAESISR